MSPQPKPAQDPAVVVPALQVVELEKTYETGVHALKGVSLSVAEGDFF
ncbi:MAG TPA: ABC transporter ATP-binding protein, partial [Xanthomonadaceae bacterium]|nr:ABC transporter ATP-binding protein [Xanthomonadaceae bacterium]